MIKDFPLKNYKKLPLKKSELHPPQQEEMSQKQIINSEVKDYLPVLVPNTELRTIYSEVLKQEMNLYIKLP